MTFEELEKAKWDSLAPGIYGISISDTKQKPGDSIKFIFKVSAGIDVDSDSLFSTDPGNMNEVLRNWLDEYMHHSQSGYLRTSTAEILRAGRMHIQVYLHGTYDSTGPLSFRSDSILLKSIPGVDSVEYISPEKMSKIFSDGTDNNWEKVLDANPFPPVIELTLDRRRWTKESLAELKNSITERIVLASDVSYPLRFVENDTNYFYIEYRRMRKQTGL